MIQRFNPYLLVLLSAILLSSCGTLREAPSRPGTAQLTSEEVKTYERRLGMPLTGKENPELIREVSAWMGTPYRYGGSTKTGADCSGFVWSVYRDVYGISIPRTTTGMISESQRVRQRRLREGDLVFFRTKGIKISHVGIYLGNGHFVHTSTSRGVIINELDEDYYARRFRRGGRFW